nr:hypothetical protein CFP56_71922 [Quercus suber]
MGKQLDVPNFFSAVYLVDLTPSLLKIAQARFEALGWTNVNVICMDCRYFDLSDHISGKDRSCADLITMSYSLTMIPDFFPVIDMASSLLATTGIIGIVDFYAQTETEFMRRDYIGGFLDRHCSWLNRTFWRTWFEQDRVMFDGGRRDYLEYRFGTRVSINKRNAMLPGLRIPFYIWIGCSKHSASTQLDASVVKTSFLLAPEGCQRPDVPLPSVYYQNHERRTYYEDDVSSPKLDGHRSLASATGGIKDAESHISIKSSDIVLAYTSLGDTVIQIALQKPKSMHFVDADSTQNHALELKLAALQVLEQEERHKLFEQRDSSGFRDLLVERLSPYLSSQALQYWLNHGSKGWLSDHRPHPELKWSPGFTQPSLKDFGDLQIHTANMSDVLARTDPDSLTIVFLPATVEVAASAAETLIRALNRSLVKGGRVLVDTPWYNQRWQELGFESISDGSTTFRVYNKVSHLVK